jgi:glycosyltransferase involved in cell wall biosynthesis
MKILFVCQQYIHSARWIGQLKDSDHEIYVFDCLDRPIHEDLQWTNGISNWSRRKIPRFKGEHFLRKKLPKLYEVVEPFLKVTASQKLKEIIQDIQPDLVHSLEMQSQSYPIEKVRRKASFNWAYFSWGSDLFLYKDDPVHSQKIKKVLSKVDFFFADNTRDIRLAKELGFQGKAAAVFPGGGGYDLASYVKYIQPMEDRNTILIKGYHHWVGRALPVLDALEMIVDKVKTYQIYVFSAHQIVVDRIEELKKKHGLKIEYSSRSAEISHKDLLQKFGKSILAIGNSISDGIPNTLLESIVLGAFPIQSNPGGVTEDYIEDGKNGLLIQNPENPEEIAEKIRFALEHPKLIHQAFEINQEKAKKLDYKNIQQQVLEQYKHIENTL